MTTRQKVDKRRRSSKIATSEPIIKHIFEQASRMLATKSGNSNLIKHNLEKGLGNEQSLRELLRVFLPRRYGVAKGKVVNSKGMMSRHIDVIIYDALYCPTLFVDENENQILPIEGVYAAVEVKTTLTSTTLTEAFENLFSVYGLAQRIDTSKNDFITRCFPFLEIFAFNDKRSLDRIGRQFIRLSKNYDIKTSCYSYTPKSPGFAEHTGRKHLVCSIHVLNTGCIRHMLAGDVTFSAYGEYTLGMFLTGLLDHFANAPVPEIDMHAYASWFEVGLWQNPNKPPIKYVPIIEE